MGLGNIFKSSYLLLLAGLKVSFHFTLLSVSCKGPLAITASELLLVELQSQTVHSGGCLALGWDPSKRSPTIGKNLFSKLIHKMVQLEVSELSGCGGMAILPGPGRFKDRDQPEVT